MAHFLIKRNGYFYYSAHDHFSISMRLNIKLMVKLTLSVNTPQKEEKKHFSRIMMHLTCKLLTICQSQDDVCRLTLHLFILFFPETVKKKKL